MSHGSNRIGTPARYDDANVTMSRSVTLVSRRESATRSPSGPAKVSRSIRSPGSPTRRSTSCCDLRRVGQSRCEPTVARIAAPACSDRPACARWCLRRPAQRFRRNARGVVRARSTTRTIGPRDPGRARARAPATGRHGLTVRDALDVVGAIDPTALEGLRHDGCCERLPTIRSRSVRSSRTTRYAELGPKLLRLRPRGNHRRFGVPCVSAASPARGRSGGGRFDVEEDIRVTAEATSLFRVRWY